MVRYSALAKGRVQGVGFRFFVQGQASKYGLTGWVKNLDNGMVQMEAQGSEQRIEVFFDDIKVGNRFIRVDELTLESIPINPDEKDFKMVY